jgi:hypothetical protein
MRDGLRLNASSGPALRSTAEASRVPKKSRQDSYATGEQLARSRDDLLIQSQLVTKVLLIAATIAPRAGAAMMSAKGMPWTLN